MRRPARSTFVTAALVLGLVSALVACSDDASLPSPLGSADPAGASGEESVAEAERGPGDVPTVDAAPDASAPVSDASASDGSASACDVTKPFGAPALVSAVGNVWGRGGITLTTDELVVYFSVCVDQPGNYCGPMLRTASRASASMPFGATSDVVGGFFVYNPSVSADHLWLFGYKFSAGPYDAVRANVGEPFKPLPSSTERRLTYAIGSARGSVVSRAYRQAGAEMWHTREEGRVYFAQFSASSYGPPVEVPELGKLARDPRPSEDGLTVVFASTRPGSQGEDLYIAKRATTSAPFDPPVAIAEVNTALEEYSPWLSPDQCRLYFLRRPTGGVVSVASLSNTAQMFVASRPK